MERVRINAFERSGRRPAVSREGREPVAQAAVDLSPSALTRSRLVQAMRGGSAARVGPVQRITGPDLQERGARVSALADEAPLAGVNLWVAQSDLPAQIHLLGTGHGLSLSEMGGENAHARSFLLAYLQSEPFTHIYTEKPVVGPNVTVETDLLAKLEEKRRAARVVGDLPVDAGKIPRARAEQKLGQANLALSNLDTVGLDDAYSYVARTTPDGKKKEEPAPVIGALETDETRAEAMRIDRRDLGPDEPGQLPKLEPGEGEPDTGYGDVIAGNQQDLFREVAAKMLAGRDVSRLEERNRQWITRLSTPGTELATNDRQLWIVGANHLPGLILRLRDLGWAVAHRDLPAVPQAQAQPQAGPNQPDDGAD